MVTFLFFSDTEANAASSGETTRNDSERAWADAKSLIEKEEQEVEVAIKETVELEVSNNLQLPIDF